MAGAASPAHLSPGMAQGWWPAGTQGTATCMGLERLAEQLSLRRRGRRPLGSVNYSNIGKCVEQRMPAGPRMLGVMCDVFLPAWLSRQRVGWASEWPWTRGQLPAGNHRLGWVALVAHGDPEPCLAAHGHPLSPRQTSTMVRTSTTPRATRSPRRCRRARKPCPTSMSRPPCPPSSAPAARRVGTVSRPRPPMASAQGYVLGARGSAPGSGDRGDRGDRCSGCQRCL